ncbi:MAG: GNAT family N-acetyltransferase [Thermoleophilia bacterium]|nr:GNAT family N-acetyltransferase [Thermoleophilia bacterium]
MIARWGRERFLARLGDVVAIYETVWARAGSGQRDVSARRATCPDFVCAAALEDERLLGFAYGSAGRPGEWWHERVAPAASAAARGEWFADYFVIAEVAVLPEAQGRGLGRRLMEELLAAPEVRRHPVALLMVDDANERARALYRSLGFEDGVREFRFTPDGDTKRVMGRRLRDVGPPRP